MADGIHRLLNQLEITRLGRLVVNSRFTVEGQLQGAHPSPLKGFSVEFADYRQYVPGDDLRHLDWRVYGRSERLYIRQYEEECNLRVYLLVDASRSMAYGSGAQTKYQYAAKLAAAIAYVTVQQQDSVGLTIFTKDREVHLPARGGSQHLRAMANALADFTPAKETALARQIHLLAEAVHRRALVILISDGYEDLDALRGALGHFRKAKHYVIAYQVLDAAELDFPFRDIGNFEDLETGAHLITDPRGIREAYQEAFGAFLRDLKALCAGMNVDYQLARTDASFIPFVQNHLHRRLGRRK